MSKISVIQPGARLHYAMPAIFARAGLLTTLYTDLHADHWWMRAADRMLPGSLKPKLVRRLLGRRLAAGLPPRLVADRPLLTMLSHLAERAGVGNAMATTSRRILEDIERAGLGQGDTVYTVPISGDLETMQRLKDRGVRIVFECMIAPHGDVILGEERALMPGLEPDDDSDKVAADLKRDAEKYAVADLIMAPSLFVRDAVAELVDDLNKIRVVPYGFDVGAIDWSQCRPIAGRVLCVGSVGLRKGNHYLADAARRLGSTAEVHVVGPIKNVDIGHAAFRGPIYRGQIPRTDVSTEFLQADVFALPSLCEGMALSHLEAMAYGIPVVTTPNCGSVVRDGVDGFVVPIRDPAALADAIARITNDRALREKMSQNARRRAEEFSLDAYAQRLLKVLTE